MLSVSVIFVLCVVYMLYLCCVLFSGCVGFMLCLFHVVLCVVGLNPAIIPCDARW